MCVYCCLNVLLNFHPLLHCFCIVFSFVQKICVRFVDCVFVVCVWCLCCCGIASHISIVCVLCLCIVFALFVHGFVRCVYIVFEWLYLCLVSILLLGVFVKFVHCFRICCIISQCAIVCVLFFVLCLYCVCIGSVWFFSFQVLRMDCVKYVYCFRKCSVRYSQCSIVCV